MEIERTKKEVAALRGLFHVLIHELLKTGRQVTYEQIGEKYNSRYSFLIHGPEGNRYKWYEESMRKAMSDISLALKSQGMDIIREGSRKKGYLYSYPEGACEYIELWLDKKSHNKKRMRVSEIIKLIAMSKGLLPKTWVANLIPQIEALEKMEAPKTKIIEFDYNDLLTNIYKVPDFLDAIEGKKVLSLINNAGYKYEVPIVFIPYYIKEYNHRFFCIGHCKKSDGTEIEDYVIAIDRVSNVEECRDEPYIPPQKDYSHYYEDIVGVRHEVDFETGNPLEIQHILIETQNIYTHGRIISKPLHTSQKEVAKFGDIENGLGMVSIDVVPNMELTSMLLGFGSNIKIVSPALVIERITNNAKRLLSLYEKEIRKHV